MIKESKREQYKACINVLLKDIEVLEILEKHPLFNLKLLFDYDNFEEYWEDYSETYDELNEYEFETLKQWQKKYLYTKK